MTHRSRLALSSALVSALLVASSVAAQDEPPPAYETAIGAALDEFAAGHWAEARALFEEAHAAYPNARTLRGIGMASFELRDYPAAVRALDASLASERRALTDEQRTQVTELLGRARVFVGRYVVPASASAIELTVDGVRAVPDGDWPRDDGVLLLGLGDHVVRIAAADRRSAEVRVTVRGNDDETLDLSLAQTHDEVGARVLPPPPEAPDGPDPTGWILLGTGLGTAVVGAILLGVGYADIASVQNAMHGTEWSALSGAYDRAPVLTGLGAALLGVGGAIGIVGLAIGATSGGGGEARATLGPGTLALEVTF